MRVSFPSLKKAIWVLLISVLVAVVGISTTAVFWLRQHPLGACSRTEKSALEGPQGRTVIVMQELCDGFASQDGMAIEMRSSTGRKVTVFSFEAAHSFVKDPRLAEPTITWVDATDLRISVAEVASIRAKVENVDGVHVIYDIGRVRYK